MQRPERKAIRKGREEDGAGLIEHEQLCSRGYEPLAAPEIVRMDFADQGPLIGPCGLDGSNHEQACELPFSGVDEDQASASRDVASLVITHLFRHLERDGPRSQERVRSVPVAHEDKGLETFAEPFLVLLSVLLEQGTRTGQNQRETEDQKSGLKTQPRPLL